MPDWFVWLTPLALVPIALLFLFVGCGLDSRNPYADFPVLYHKKVLVDPDESTKVDVKNIRVVFEFKTPYFLMGSDSKEFVTGDPAGSDETKIGISDGVMTVRFKWDVTDVTGDPVADTSVPEISLDSCRCIVTMVDGSEKSTNVLTGNYQVGTVQFNIARSNKVENGPEFTLSALAE